jgi:hypothetical protein
MESITSFAVASIFMANFTNVNELLESILLVGVLLCTPCGSVGSKL